MHANSLDVIAKKRLRFSKHKPPWLLAGLEKKTGLLSRLKLIGI